MKSSFPCVTILQKRFHHFAAGGVILSKKNELVRIQDDLYQHVNGEWIKNAVIPADKPMTGGFSSLAEDVEKLLMNDCAKLASGKETSDIPIITDAVCLYKKALDVKARRDQGMMPLYNDV